MKQILRFCPAEPLIQTNRAFVRLNRRLCLVEKYGRFYEHFVEHFFPTANSCMFESYLSVGKMPNAKWNT